MKKSLSEKLQSLQKVLQSLAHWYIITLWETVSATLFKLNSIQIWPLGYFVFKKPSSIISHFESKAFCFLSLSLGFCIIAKTNNLLCVKLCNIFSTQNTNTFYLIDICFISIFPSWAEWSISQLMYDHIITNAKNVCLFRVKYDFNFCSVGYEY